MQRGEPSVVAVLWRRTAADGSGGGRAVERPHATKAPRPSGRGGGVPGMHAGRWLQGRGGEGRKKKAAPAARVSQSIISLLHLGVEALVCFLAKAAVRLPTTCPRACRPRLFEHRDSATGRWHHVQRAQLHGLVRPRRAPAAAAVGCRRQLSGPVGSPPALHATAHSAAARRRRRPRTRRTRPSAASAQAAPARVSAPALRLPLQLHGSTLLGAASLIPRDASAPRLLQTAAPASPIVDKRVLTHDAT